MRPTAGKADLLPCQSRSRSARSRATAIDDAPCARSKGRWRRPARLSPYPCHRVRTAAAFGIAGIAGVGKVLGGLDGQRIHHFQARRQDAARDQGATAFAASRTWRSRPRLPPWPRAAGQQAHRRLDDHGRGAPRTRQQRQEVRTRCFEAVAADAAVARHPRSPASGRAGCAP
jgi:hypothetical protein